MKHMKLWNSIRLSRHSLLSGIYVNKYYIKNRTVQAQLICIYEQNHGEGVYEHYMVKQQRIDRIIGVK